MFGMVNSRSFGLSPLACVSQERLIVRIVDFLLSPGSGRDYLGRAWQQAIAFSLIFVLRWGRCAVF